MQATTKTKTNEGIKIGDVFHSGHGWNGSMTRKFYMVTALNGRTQATLTEFEPEHPVPTAKQRAKLGPYDSLVKAGSLAGGRVMLGSHRKTIVRSVVPSRFEGDPTAGVRYAVRINDYETAGLLEDTERVFVERY